MRYPLAIFALASLALTAGCGTSEPTATSTPAATSSSSGPITATDSRGKTVTLNAPATRVVTLEWGQTEDVVTLGVQPVGAADPKGYSSWVSAAPLTGSTIDVGLRSEPSQDSVARANPELIIGIENSIPEAAMAQLEQLAPVFILKGADATRPQELMRENFTTIAKLLGKQDRATAVLADLDAAIASGKTALAGAASRPFSLMYISATGNTVDLRMHSERSAPGSIAKELGLKNAWSDPGDAAWGIGSLDLEGLTKLPADQNILYWGNKGVADPVTGVLTRNAIWKNLPAVKSGNVVRVGEGVWLYGGPASTRQWINELTRALG